MKTVTAWPPPGKRMKTLRCILVDDDREVRGVLSKLLGTQCGIDVVGEAQNLAEAIDLLAGEPPDVVFLDISLPPDSGFNLLPHVPPATHVVFITGHAGHAVRAFEVNALDYLIKPVLPARLTQTIERLRAAEPPAGTVSVTLGAPLKREQISSADISAIVADGNYSRVHTLVGREFFTRSSMLEWRHLLADAGFMKLSRSLIINSAAVVRLEVRSRDTAFCTWSALPRRSPSGAAPRSVPVADWCRPHPNRQF